MPVSRKIGLISAVPFEASLLANKLKRKKKSPFAFGRTAGKTGQKELAYACSGIGPANAAHAFTLMAEVLKPDLIILFGIGGAYPGSGFYPGQVVMAETEIYGDSGVIEEKGFRDMSAIGFPLLKKGKKAFFNEFPLRENLVKKLSKALKIPMGRFITVCAGTRSRKRALELEKRWGGLVENMEGAAMAQMALLYGIPFLEIRGISNIVGDPPAKWQKELAAENCQKAVLEILKIL